MIWLLRQTGNSTVPEPLTEPRVGVETNIETCSFHRYTLTRDMFCQIAVKGLQASLEMKESRRGVCAAIAPRSRTSIEIASIPQRAQPEKGNETRPNYPHGRTLRRRQESGAKDMERQGSSKGITTFGAQPRVSTQTSILGGARTPQMQPRQCMRDFSFQASPESKGGTRQCVDTPIVLGSSTVQATAET